MGVKTEKMYHRGRHVDDESTQLINQIPFIDPTHLKRNEKTTSYPLYIKWFIHLFMD